MIKDVRFEYLRISSCFMVIFGHIANWYNREYPKLSMGSYVCATLVNSICRISVPIFFMISGALLMKQDMDIRKNGNRIKNLLLKIIIWSVVYIIWDYIYLGDSYDLKSIFSVPVRTHFWFLYALFGVYVTLPLWQKIVHGISAELMKYMIILFFACLTINYILKICGMEVSYPIPVFGETYYAGYFIAGYILSQFADKMKLSRIVCAGIAGVCMLITAVLTLVYSIKENEHIEIFFEFRSIFISIAAMAVFLIVMKTKNLRHYSWMEKISKHSFGIYMTHVFFLDILQENIDVFAISAWIGTPLFFVILLGCSYAFSWSYDKAKGSVKVL